MRLVSAAGDFEASDAPIPPLASRGRFIQKSQIAGRAQWRRIPELQCAQEAMAIHCTNRALTDIDDRQLALATGTDVHAHRLLRCQLLRVPSHDEVFL